MEEAYHPAVTSRLTVSRVSPGQRWPTPTRLCHVTRRDQSAATSRRTSTNWWSRTCRPAERGEGGAEGRPTAMTADTTRTATSTRPCWTARRRVVSTRRHATKVGTAPWQLTNPRDIRTKALFTLGGVRREKEKRKQKVKKKKKLNKKNRLAYIRLHIILVYWIECSVEFNSLSNLTSRSWLKVWNVF